MRALVTGAAGFVGRWLTTALRNEGIAVTGLAVSNDHGARGGPGSESAGPPIDWRFGDLRDDAFVANVVDASRPDYVVHLAAISHLPTAAADPV